MEQDKIFIKIKGDKSFLQGLSSFIKNKNTSGWIILPNQYDKYVDFKDTKVIEILKKQKFSNIQYNKQLKKIFQYIRKNYKNKEVEQFEYENGFFAMICPIMNDKVYLGSIIILGLKKKFSSYIEKVILSFVNTVIDKNKKEVELEEINKTIRPRAIALSTVHTVHRLMTSSVELTELLPRIARLALQIIRANRCSIKLVDKKKKILIPKTTIDLRKKKTKLKKVQIGKYAPGRAVKKENAVCSAKYLAVPMIDQDVVGVITLYDKIDGREFTPFDEEIMKTLCEQAAIAIRNAQLFKEQTDITLSSIKCIAQLLESSSKRVRRAEATFLKLIHVVGAKFNMNLSEIKMLQYSAMLHDAGHICIPEEVLMKKTGLTGHEYELVKTHPKKAATMLSKFIPLKPIVPIILYHHENFDGSGYPKGLKGKEIPIPARIFAVIGAFESMIMEKPYRKAFSINAAIKEIKKNINTQFDPKVV